MEIRLANVNYHPENGKPAVTTRNVNIAPGKTRTLQFGQGQSVTIDNTPGKELVYGTYLSSSELKTRTREQPWDNEQFTFQGEANGTVKVLSIYRTAMLSEHSDH